MCDREDYEFILNKIEFIEQDSYNKLAINDLRKVFIEAPFGKKGGYIDMIFGFQGKNILFEVKPRPYNQILAEKRNFESQLERYYSFMNKPICSKNAQELVKSITETLINAKNYLVCITDENKLPSELKSFATKKNWELSKVGRLSYKVFRKIALKKEYEIKGKSHVWIEPIENSLLHPE